MAIKRRHALVIALSCIVFLMPGTVRDGNAQPDNSLSRATLKGLTGVEVVVDYEGPDLEQAELSRTILQTDAELTLRGAGIPTFRQPSISSGGLYLGVNCMGLSQFQSYVCSVSLELWQAVALLRNPTMTATGTTWSTNHTYVFGDGRFSDVRASIQDLVKQFVNAYLEQNPRNP